MPRYKVHLLWSLALYQPATVNRKPADLVEDIVLVDAPGPEEASRMAFQKESEDLAATNLGLREDVLFAVAVGGVELAPTLALTAQ